MEQRFFTYLFWIDVCRALCSRLDAPTYLFYHLLSDLNSGARKYDGAYVNRCLEYWQRHQTEFRYPHHAAFAIATAFFECDAKDPKNIEPAAKEAERIFKELQMDWPGPMMRMLIRAARQIDIGDAKDAQLVAAACRYPIVHDHYTTLEPGSGFERAEALCGAVIEPARVFFDQVGTDGYIECGECAGKRVPPADCATMQFQIVAA